MIRPKEVLSVTRMRDRRQITKDVERLEEHIDKMLCDAVEDGKVRPISFVLSDLGIMDPIYKAVCENRDHQAVTIIKRKYTDGGWVVRLVDSGTSRAIIVRPKD
jgi:hypothetical protein